MESPFEVLGIDPDADEDEIERAYRDRVKETHPDHGGSAAAFQRVRTAYEELIEGDRTDASEVVGSDGSDRDGVDDEPGGGGRAEPEPESSVEYLNYEALGDLGLDLGHDDLFERASTADLDRSDYGRFSAERDETLLESAEDCGYTWPFACRGGACANCAVAVLEGDLSQPVDHILPPEVTDRGIRLSCVGKPITDEVRVVYNVKHLPYLEDLRLPPRPFEQAHGSD